MRDKEGKQKWIYVFGGMTLQEEKYSDATSFERLDLLEIGAHIPNSKKVADEQKEFYFGEIQVEKV